MSDAARQAIPWCAPLRALDKAFVAHVNIDVGTHYLVGASPALSDERAQSAAG